MTLQYLHLPSLLAIVTIGMEIPDTNSGTYDCWSMAPSMFGCDSTSILVLSITGNSTSSFVTSCDFYIWNGNTYSSSGTYTYNNGACTDSLILVINNSSSSLY